jgi:hypothetical protein
MSLKLRRYQSYEISPTELMRGKTTMVIQLSIGRVLELRFSLVVCHDYSTERLYDDHLNWIRKAYGLPTWTDFI